MALGFEQTATGYVATAEQIAWWDSRDCCQGCVAIVEPIGKTDDGRWIYRCSCEPGVEWTAYSPADCT